MRWVVIVLLASVGCVTSTEVVCRDGRVCPAKTICDDQHALCVVPDQLAQCASQDDGAPCTVSDVRGMQEGTCHEAVCLPSECGNGRLDVGEVCDTMALADGERCNETCKSNETCGNGIIDTITGEQCDDGNTRSHDGCASACVLETVDWWQTKRPPPTNRAAATLDVARGKVVMFHGDLGEVFEWDGDWHELTGVASPSPREGFCLVYAPALGGVVLYGGAPFGGATELSDTWLWNGSRWTALPAGPARQRAALAYDAKRGVVIMFGGVKTSGHQSTWELSSTGWTQITTAQKPPATQKANGVAMAYDAKHGNTVLYDGTTSETWIYDGASWSVRSPATVPTIKLPAMTYNSSLEQVVMFGGNEGAVPSSRTYFWTGSDWTLSTSAPAGAARARHAFAEDPNGRMFIFGGGPNGAELDSLWFSDGVTWTEAEFPPAYTSFSAAYVPTRRTLVRFGGSLMDGADAEPPVTWERSPLGWQSIADGPLADDSPPGLILSRMVYDTARDEVVLFGGTDINGLAGTLDDATWVRAGSSWTVHRLATAPQGRAHHAMAYDEAHGKVVLYGGVTLDGTFLGDTWSWDGTGWTQQVTPPALGARDSAAMAYDRAAGHVVLFGGRASIGTLQNDVWIWDGSQWQQVTVTSGEQPEPSWGASLTWDPAGARLLLTGGISRPFDTWVWAGNLQQSKWTRITAFHVPPTRNDEVVLASPDGAGVTVYGGAVNGTPATEIWELRSTSTSGSDGCALPLDVDGDGRTLCDDDDCWFVCSPVCPPATSCGAGTPPSCGDGTCSAIESCKSCPSDCTTGCAPVCGDFLCDAGELCPGDCP